VSKKGEGTFSEVLKAQCIKDGKYVAIKCMKNKFDSLDQVRLEQETWGRVGTDVPAAIQRVAGKQHARQDKNSSWQRCAASTGGLIAGFHSSSSSSSSRHNSTAPSTTASTVAAHSSSSTMPGQA
jgi:serine/threonine protein kinase